MLKKSGFTLIELLVVVSIIAILSTIGLAAYSSVLEQGRDSKRLSDLRSIQSALEQYYADQFFYPSSITFGSALTNLIGRPTPTPTPPLRTYLNTVPTGSPAYVYTALPSSCNNSTTNCTSYCLYAKLENLPSPAPSPPSGCTYPSGGYNFAVTPP